MSCSIFVVVASAPDDHYFNFPLYSYLTLDSIGWQFAPVLLRVAVRYLANEIVPPKGPDVEALRLQGDLRPPRSLYGRSSTGWEELTASNYTRNPTVACDDHNSSVACDG